MIQILTDAILSFDLNSDGKWLLLAIVLSSTLEKMLDHVKINQDFNLKLTAGHAHNSFQQLDKFRPFDCNCNCFQMGCDSQIFHYLCFLKVNERDKFDKMRHKLLLLYLRERPFQGVYRKQMDPIRASTPSPTLDSENRHRKLLIHDIRIR